MRNAVLEETQVGIKIARKISITSDMQMAPPLWQNVTHLFQNFPQFIVIHTVKGFGVVNKAEIYVFL